MATFRKLIFDDLKDLPEIKNKIKSIRLQKYSLGSSLYVDTVNLRLDQREKLDEILEKYEKGSFDGMNDIYIYKKNQNGMTVSYIIVTNREV